MNFFCRLIPPRPTFATDMSPEEGALMQEHAAYWSEGIPRQEVIAFGYVAGAEGGFGVGIVEFPDEAAVRAFTDGDPTIRSGSGFRFELSPMPMGVVRG